MAKTITWTTRPRTVQEAIWIEKALDEGDIEAVMHLIVSRSDGQLSEAAVLAMPLTDCVQLLRGVIDSLVPAKAGG